MKILILMKKQWFKKTRFFSFLFLSFSLFSFSSSFLLLFFFFSSSFLLLFFFSSFLLFFFSSFFFFLSLCMSWNNQIKRFLSFILIISNCAQNEESGDEDIFAVGKEEPTQEKTKVQPPLAHQEKKPNVSHQSQPYQPNPTFRPNYSTTAPVFTFLYLSSSFFLLSFIN